MGEEQNHQNENNTDAMQITPIGEALLALERLKRCNVHDKAEFAVCVARCLESTLMALQAVGDPTALVEEVSDTVIREFRELLTTEAKAPEGGPANA